MAASTTLPEVGMTFDAEGIREDFPVLQQQIHGKPLVYLDNAATSQKPRSVVDTIERYYLTENSNVHRGIHLLSERATEAFEGARAKVARFFNVGDVREIVFVRGATEGINLVAQSFVRPRLAVGDEILISEMEHHSNIVPWQIACEQTGAVLRVVPINDDGELRLDEYERLLGPRTRLVSIVHVSNALGTINPVKQVIGMAHERGIPVLIDGAQAAPHLAVDVQALDCDFYVCSGHKLFGPTGIGIMFGKARHLEAMPPYQGGGDMILSVTFEKTIYNEAPLKFEAGTPHIAGAIGLGAAIDYVGSIGLDRIAAYEGELLAYATDAVSAIPGIRIIGTAKEKASILSFVLDDIHAHDIGTILDQEGIAIRTGHHCAQPVLQRFRVPATARVSVAFYNTQDEIDALVRAIYKVTELFG
ncbi:Highly similar to cysteine desulfurase [Candidatus Methylomirabilis oxygeniifera]|uniref:Cysteine desulfurase n=1 Tax=Methylomirabilis oxygeniifera TaxID=671143 RepID=D5MIS1_METO1|nr:Highly similar to cysteine desulfurase [Candidatus Methylomirabilis oxyfera]